jgi:hypothetical protein
MSDLEIGDCTVRQFHALDVELQHLAAMNGRNFFDQGKLLSSGTRLRSKNARCLSGLPVSRFTNDFA